MFLQAPQPDKFWMGGRGTGKSSVEGAAQFQSACFMPRGKTFLSSNTYGQLLTKTLPAMEFIMQKHGLREHIKGRQAGHYVIGQKPPRNWDTCLKPPKQYKNVVSFFNGFCMEMLSMDRPDLARGGSYDGGGIDEAYTVEEEEYSRIIVPSCRGNVERYDTPLHQQIRAYFTVPWNAKGEWLYKYEEFARLYPDLYLWMESVTRDNERVIGKKSIDRMQRNMNALDYAVECENQRFTKSPDAFYRNFDDSRHMYSPSWAYGETERGIVTSGRKRAKHDGYLAASFDFGGWFNCMTIWQEEHGTEYCIDALDVSDQSIDVVLKRFVSRYADHPNKHLDIYGEFHGKDKQAVGESLYERVIRILNDYGWSCDLMVEDPADSHEMRFEMLNEILSETDHTLPKIKINNVDARSLAICLKRAKVKADYSKDKKEEKNRSADQRTTTHYTDTFDYYILQKYGHRMGITSMSRGNRAGFF